ncbi:hypothetical protein ACLMJK_000479 [Lecanora helva]
MLVKLYNIIVLVTLLSFVAARPGGSRAPCRARNNGNGNTQSQSSNTNGGSPSPPSSNGGTSNLQSSNGGNLAPPSSSGGAPNLQSSGGGNPNPQSSNGGGPNSQSSNGGNLNPQSSNGGNPNSQSSNGGVPSSQSQSLNANGGNPSPLSQGPSSNAGNPNPQSQGLGSNGGNLSPLSNSNTKSQKQSLNSNGGNLNMQGLNSDDSSINQQSQQPNANGTNANPPSPSPPQSQPQKPASNNVVPNSQPSQNMCGNDQKVILTGTPWLVANSMYGAGSMQGTSCTYYDHIEAGAGGNQAVVWSNSVNIQNVQGTDNICKGYANVGIVGGLENSISSISSVPANYQWTRSSQGPFKGNIIFDFILGAAKGDSTSSAAQELMLWLEWEGGQLPIGWDAGPAATIDSLFGTSWKVYEGKSPNNGMTVHSMLPDSQFSGSFNGDLKDWFESLVKIGKFTDATFVNIGNAG